MTSGLPLAAALLRRAGTLVPASVAAAVSLPVWLVFVGTVLLSVVLGWCCLRAGRDRSATANEERPRIGPLARHGKPPGRQGAGGDPPWACRHRHQRLAPRGVP